VPEDDRAVRAKLEALEAEVKAEQDAARVRKEAALASVREQRAKQLAERQALRDRQAELVTGKARGKRASEPPPESSSADADDDDEPLLARGRAALRDGNALELARKAGDMRGELARPRKAGEKSWKLSGGLSLFLGPLGWLYAGSLRETIPIATGWLVVAAIFSKLLSLFSFLFLPVLAVVMPLSGIAGILYATSYNKHGKRQRLFTKEPVKKPKAVAGKKKPQLPSKT
jgi:hypothetical protein